MRRSTSITDTCTYSVFSCPVLTFPSGAETGHLADTLYWMGYVYFSLSCVPIPLCHSGLVEDKLPNWVRPRYLVYEIMQLSGRPDIAVMRTCATAIDAWCYEILAGKVREPCLSWNSGLSPSEALQPSLPSCKGKMFLSAAMWMRHYDEAAREVRHQWWL